MDLSGPSAKLIDQGAYTYIQNTLHNCREHRTRIFYISLNIGVFLLFFGIATLVLYYCYHQKKSPYELHQKQLKDQEYILSKIRFYQGHMKNVNIRDKSNITSLPPIDAPISKAYLF